MPGCDKSGSGGASGGRGGMNGRAISFIASSEQRSCAPHTWITTDDPGLRHPSRLAQRGDHVVGEEERRETGDEVEGVVPVRQGLHVADTEVGLRKSLARERDQRLRRIDPVRLGAASGDQAEEDADPAADVEHTLARSSATRSSAAS